MSAFESLQAEFARAVRDPARPVPDALASSRGVRPVRRFAVYRNNVVVGLVDALRTRFPATERIVGSDFFVFMARAFISACPPESPVLTLFGDRLPEFLAGFEPASELPYLADVVRIECARTHAYHARDATPSDLSGLSSLEPEVMARARLILHPSLVVVRSAFPAFTIWSMNADGDSEAHAVDLCRSEDAVIVRPELDVVVESLPEGGAAFIDALRTSAFADAAGETVQASPDFDLGSILAQLIRVGAFAGFQIDTSECGGNRKSAGAG